MVWQRPQQQPQPLLEVPQGSMLWRRQYEGTQYWGPRVGTSEDWVSSACVSCLFGTVVEAVEVSDRGHCLAWPIDLVVY